MECENNNDDVMNVCRLCLGTDNLNAIFDDRIRIPKNMKDIIQITTGVTISPSDNVSQKLCYQCINITIRMFKFRSSSIVNDLELRERGASKKRMLKLHKSVQSLLNQFPNIVLPSSITKINISPVVGIYKNEVKNWMEKYRGKKKLEELNMSRMENGDLEKEITPYIISNREIITIDQVERNPREIKAVGRSISCPIPKIMTTVDETEPSSNQETPMSSVTDGDIDNVGSEAFSKENKGKRKLTIDSNDSKIKNVKLNSRNDEIDSLLDLKYVNDCIQVCNICHSISYNKKDLKKHLTKHMRCSLCKKSFRSLQETEDHSQNHCTIKHIMNNLPKLHLQRCNESKKIREQYASAFAAFPQEKLENSSTSQTSQIPPETTCDKADTVEYPNTSAKLENEITIENEGALVEPTRENGFSCAQCSSSEKDSSFICSEIQKFEEGNIPSVKPIVEITGANILNLNLEDDEISLVKNILKQSRGNINESSTQTDFPTNSEIITSKDKDKLFELRNLRQFLSYYKIPINLSYASNYSAKYGNDSSQLAKFNNFTWSILKSRGDPAMTTHSDVKSSQNDCTKESRTKETNEGEHFAPLNTSMRSSMLMKTSSQTPSPTVLPVLNIQMNSRAVTNSANQTKGMEILSTSSTWKRCGNMQNVHNNTSSHNAPIMSKSYSKVRMHSTKSSNAKKTITPTNSAVFHDKVSNSISTNQTSKEISFSKDLVSIRSASQTKATPNRIHNINACHEAAVNPRISQIVLYKKPNSLLSEANGVAPIQEYTVTNIDTNVAPAGISNVRGNDPHIVKTSSTPAVNNRIPDACQNKLNNMPIASSFKKTENFCLANVSSSSNTKIHGKHEDDMPKLNNVLLQTSSYKKSSQSILKINFQNVYEQFQASTSSTASYTENNYRKILSQGNPSISLVSVPANNLLRPPVIVSPRKTNLTRKSDHYNVWAVNKELPNGERNQPATMAASSSQWNENPNFPSIRVKNVSELR